MATPLQPTEWIDRYVAAVGHMLPARQRADVEAEIRSLLQDELDAQPTADEAAVLNVLQRFGRPTEVAVRYGATQYLIGPVLYPTFVTVLRIVLAVSVALAFFGFAVSVGLEGATPSIAQVLASLVTALFQAGAAVVLTFAIIDRLNRGILEKPRSEWNPRTLAAVHDEDRVKTGEMVANIAFTIIALLVLNVYLDQIGRYYVVGEGWQHAPFFAPEFAIFVPWLSAWWIADLALSIVVLARGRWQTMTRVLKIAVNVFGLAVLYAMLTGGPLAAWPALEPVFKLVVGIIFAAAAFDTVRIAYNMLTGARGRRSAAPQSTATFT